MKGKIGVLIAITLIAFAFLVQGVSATPAMEPLPGAVFTTLPDGNAVDENTGYENKCEVSLNGGSDRPQAHHLPDGVYDVAVTNPSGKVVLGKGEGVATIANGEGTFGPTSLCDLVKPSPYGTTPNPGGEYKAWLCKEGNLFINRSCKTDNFKVRPSEPPPVPSPTPKPTPPLGVTPTPTPTPVIGPPWSSPPEATPAPTPTLEPVQPEGFPDSGGGPLQDGRSVRWWLAVAIGLPLALAGAWLIRRQRHRSSQGAT
jgi:hypothetical protein